jgi:hypothetical protein
MYKNLVIYPVIYNEGLAVVFFFFLQIGDTKISKVDKYCPGLVCRVCTLYTTQVFYMIRY